MGTLLVSSAMADSSTKVVNSGTMTNLLTGFNNPISVQYILISAATSNASVLIYDTPTNALTYVNPAYTNTLSYATNYNTTWTNFYGVVQTNYAPIVALIDNTNNVVAATTNSYPLRAGVAALVGTSVQYSGNFNFNNGIWATNTSGGQATVTIVYH